MGAAAGGTQARPAAGCGSHAPPAAIQRPGEIRLAQVTGLWQTLVMPLMFANPLGLLALLGVPAVLAIHYLQRRTRTLPVSTLFLLEPQRDSSRMGRRFDRLLASWPMWLQLLMVVLLAALLAQPRLPVAGSVQRVAVVLDDSASMRVFKRELLRQLASLAQRGQGLARRCEFLVLLGDPARPRLYAGDSAAAMLQAVEHWNPVGGPVDPTASLRLARERVGNHGLLVYATDTPLEKLPADAVLLAVGHPIANVGFTGLSVGEKDGQPVWRALLANRSASVQERTWHLEWDAGQRSPDAGVRLAAGGMASLSAAIPAGATRLRLVLEPDEFGLDDSFAFLTAAPKPLGFRHHLPEALRWLPERLGRSVPGLTEVAAAAPADLTLAAASDGEFPQVSGPAIVMSAAGEAQAKTLAGPVVAARHPLVAGLLWETLAVQEVPMVPAKLGDVVLVWCGAQPLVSLRPLPLAAGTRAGSLPGQQLVLHFNPALSNFERLPAAAVLLLRYCEELRRAKRGTAREQLEPHQPLAPLLPGDLRGELSVETLNLAGQVLSSRTVQPNHVSGLRAPDEPGFLRVREGASVLLDGAVAFADAREGDFRACATRDGMADIPSVGTAGDALAPWWPLVVLLVLAALLASWAVAGRPASPVTAPLTNP